MIVYLFEVECIATRGWERWTINVNVAAESSDEAAIKMQANVEKSGYEVVNYRVYGFMKKVGEVCV